MRGTHRSDGSFIRMLEALVDAGLVVLGYYGAFWLRYGSNPDPRNLAPFFALIPFIVLVSLGMVVFNGLYSRDLSGRLALVYGLLSMLIPVAILTMAAAFLDRGFAFPRSVIGLGMLLQFLLLYLWKVLLFRFYWSREPRRQVMVIGNLQEASGLIVRMEDAFRRDMDLQVVALGVSSAALERLGRCDAVYLCPGIQPQEREIVIRRCLDLGVTLQIVPDLHEILMQTATVNIRGDAVTMGIQPLPLSVEKAVVKRALDLVAGGGLMLLSLPVMVVVALLILWEDGRPVFFVQRRVTRDGRVFRMYKFRTMVRNAEKTSGPVLSFREDSRVLRNGRMLRETRLDELPQLFNVLRGDMSLVGPRPERPLFVEQHRQRFPAYAYRLAVKAGITGLAQTTGRYATATEDKLRLDLLYIRSQSLLLDLRILGRTLRTMLSRQGAGGWIPSEDPWQVLSRMNGEVLDEQGERQS